MVYQSIGIKIFTLFFPRTLVTSFAYCSAEPLTFLFSAQYKFFRGLPT